MWIHKLVEYVINLFLDGTYLMKELWVSFKMRSTWMIQTLMKFDTKGDMIHNRTTKVKWLIFFPPLRAYLWVRWEAMSFLLQIICIIFFIVLYLNFSTGRHLRPKRAEGRHLDIGFTNDFFEYFGCLTPVDQCITTKSDLGKGSSFYYVSTICPILTN